MVIPIYDTRGKKVGEVELRSDIFEVPINVSLMHQAFVRQMANARQGTHNTRSRGEISRTKAKWYRQKGTGRARHGSRNANLFVGGGIAHGPNPRDYTKKMPRKMRRLALRSALSVKAASSEIIVLDELDFEEPKTARMLEVLTKLGIEGSAVVLLAERNENVERSANNLSNVKTLQASYLNIRDILGNDYIIMPKNALSVIEGFLG